MGRRTNARTQAARAVAAVVRGRSLADVMPRLSQAIPAAQRPLMRELAYGALRWHARLRAQVDALVKKPLRGKDADVDALLVIGLYQLQYLRVPEHAVVAETVEAARALGKSWAAGMVNGVLRSFQRRREELADAGSDAARHGFPDWLWRRLRAAWPEDFDAVVAASNERAPMSLRVNLRHGSRDDYLARLTAAGIPARPSPVSPAGVVLDAPADVEALPGFAAGDVSVQDIAAQQAALLLDPQPGERVLDACAAPGGKTAHLLEHADCEVMALDVDEHRLQRVGETLQRLGLTAHTLCADAARPVDWWDGRAFDRILLDAPCSATGVIRRHPDIRLLRRDADIERLAATQARMLDALWPLLAPGGMLLYATCSILPQENRDPVAAFLQRHGDAGLHDAPVSWGRDVAPGWQILPGEMQADGFYYALLRKS